MDVSYVFCSSEVINASEEHRNLVTSKLEEILNRATGSLEWSNKDEKEETVREIKANAKE